MYYVFDSIENALFMTISRYYDVQSTRLFDDGKQRRYFIAFLYVHISEKAKSRQLNYTGILSEGCHSGLKLIFTIIDWIGSTGPNWKRRFRCKKSLFMRNLRRNKVSLIAQIGAFFSSGPRMLQEPMPNKYEKCRNRDTFRLKRLL